MGSLAARWCEGEGRKVRKNAAFRVRHGVFRLSVDVGMVFSSRSGWQAPRCAAAVEGGRRSVCSKVFSSAAPLPARLVGLLQ